MRCMNCGNELFQSTTSEAIELGNGCLLVVRNIPCFMCKVCTEIHYRGDVAKRVEKISARAKELAEELQVVDFSAAA